MNNQRKEIIESLELFSSPQKQKEYQKNVPYVDIGQEMFLMWFDDCYLPEDKNFKKEFSRKELKLLKNFSNYMEQEMKELKINYEKNKNSKKWENIMLKAKETLKKLTK